jgi:radical SAM protein with 4Fe4S-binding SPASM domain
MESAFLEQHGVAADSTIFKQFAYPPGAHDAGLLKCCISADGMMYPSDKAQGFQPLAISSLRDQDILQAWLSENWAFFRGGWRLDQLYQCLDCSIFSTCSTRHNRIIPYVSLGDPYAAMPECQSTYAKHPLHTSNCFESSD